MRRDLEFFDEAELPLIYMARRLADALRVEEVLTQAGIDFLVETGVYAAGFLMRRNLTGAFFYVTAEQVEQAKKALREKSFKPIQVDQSQ